MGPGLADHTFRATPNAGMAPGAEVNTEVTAALDAATEQDRGMRETGRILPRCYYHTVPVEGDGYVMAWPTLPVPNLYTGAIVGGINFHEMWTIRALHMPHRPSRTATRRIIEEWCSIVRARLVLGPEGYVLSNRTAAPLCPTDVSMLPQITTLGNPVSPYGAMWSLGGVNWCDYFNIRRRLKWIRHRNFNTTSDVYEVARLWCRGLEEEARDLNPPEFTWVENIPTAPMHDITDDQF